MRRDACLVVAQESEVVGYVGRVGLLFYFGTAKGLAHLQPL